jgi:hypothetical protein
MFIFRNLSRLLDNKVCRRAMILATVMTKFPENLLNGKESM